MNYIKIICYFISIIGIIIIGFLSGNRYWEKINSIDELLSISSYELQSILPSFTKIKICNNTLHIFENTEVGGSILNSKIPPGTCSQYSEVKYLHTSINIRVTTIENGTNTIYSTTPTDLVSVKKIWYGNRTIHINSLEPYTAPIARIIHADQSISYDITKENQTYDKYKIIFGNKIKYEGDNFDLFDVTLTNGLNSESKKQYFLENPSIDINIIDNVSRLNILKEYNISDLRLHIFDYNLPNQNFQQIQGISKKLTVGVVDRYGTIRYIDIHQ